MNLLLKIYRHFTNWRWEIGFLDNTFEEVVNGEPLKVNWVKSLFKNCWFADPFILDYNDAEIIVLGEEYCDKLKRGRIAKMVIDRKSYQLKTWKIILDLPTHLSFPRLIRHEDGSIYIHPENSASGKHMMYRYNPKTDELTETTIVCDDPVTDAILLNYQGHELMFATKLPEPNGRVLHIYEKVGEKYKKKNSVDFDNNSARMAGDFFEANGKLYRPAQDCNGGYGKATFIQEVVYKNGLWSFKNVRRLESPHQTLKWGLHTFNHYKSMIVIDVKGPRYPKVAKILECLSKFIKK